MKKFALGLLTIATLSASLAFADAKDAGYYSKQHPLATAKAGKATQYPATNIRISNHTSNVIYAQVPNTPIYDIIYPNTDDYIKNDNWGGDTFVMLLDPNRAKFFPQENGNGNVCHYAQFDVYGNPGAYHYTIDTRLC